MRTPGLVAFAVTTAILAPVVALHLTAGPTQRQMLFAPGAEALDVNGVNIQAALDRRIADPGEIIHLDLTAGARVAVGIVVFGASGTEGERVPSPPLAILHETVTLDASITKHVALKLRGARSSFEPVAEYKIYVMAPKAADKLARMQDRAGPPVSNGDEIPDMDRDTIKLRQLMSSIGGSELSNPTDQKLFGGSAVALFEAYTRAINPAVAIDTPESAPVDRPFPVGITLKNPSKHAQTLTVRLSFPRINSDYLGIPEDAAKAEAGTPVELAAGETKRVELHVTATRAGVIGVQATVDCADSGHNCYKLFRSGAFEAVEVVAGAPVVAALHH